MDVKSGVKRGTGRERSEWFQLLDEWGAAGRPYREIAGWLTGEQALSKWWAQKLIVEYEQARGLRDPGVRRDGTFEVGASKTVHVPVMRLYEAFVEGPLRDQWLGATVLRERNSQPGRSAQFETEDASERIDVSFTAKAEGRSQVDLLHRRIASADSAAEAKARWRERLFALKSLLQT